MSLSVKSYILVILLLNCNHKYTLHGVVLELLEDIRDLGIYMDSKLKFHIHIDFTANKANCNLGIISKVFECKELDIMLKLYKSLVHPLLEYYNVIWGPYYNIVIHKIEAIQ